METIRAKLSELEEAEKGNQEKDKNELVEFLEKDNAVLENKVKDLERQITELKNEHEEKTKADKE